MGILPWSFDMKQGLLKLGFWCIRALRFYGFCVGVWLSDGYLLKCVNVVWLYSDLKRILSRFKLGSALLAALNFEKSLKDIISFFIIYKCMFQFISLFQKAELFVNNNILILLKYQH